MTEQPRGREETVVRCQFCGDFLRYRWQRGVLLVETCMRCQRAARHGRRHEGRA